MSSTQQKQSIQLLDLPESIIVSIVRSLDAKSLLSLSSLNRLFNALCIATIEDNAADDDSYLETCLEAKHTAGLRSVLDSRVPYSVDFHNVDRYLSTAANAGNPTNFEMLIELLLEQYIEEYVLYTAFHRAICWKNEELCRFLLTSYEINVDYSPVIDGYDLSESDDIHVPLLCVAANRDFMPAVEMLLEKGANVNCFGRWIDSKYDREEYYNDPMPFDFAAKNGNTTMAARLLEAGTNLVSTNSVSTSIILAVDNEDCEMLKLIFSHVVRYDATEGKSETTWAVDVALKRYLERIGYGLYNEIKWNKEHMLWILNGASNTLPESVISAVKNSTEGGCLGYACREELLPVVEWLLEQGFNIDRRGYFGTKSLLEEQCYWGHLDTAKILIKAKEAWCANVLNRALCVACQGAVEQMTRTSPDARLTDQVDIITELVAAGADFNALVGKTDVPTRTALHHLVFAIDNLPAEHKTEANKQRLFKLATVLLEAGADVSIKDSEGKTPIDIAAEKFPDLVPLFEKYRSGGKN